MTGDEILVQARAAFGERNAAALTDLEFKDFINQALQVLYDWLPPHENTQSIDTDALALTAGKGTVLKAWDKILEVSDATGPLTPVEQPVIANIDRYGDYFVPATPVWYFDGDTLHVRPHTTPVQVTHTKPPAKITNFAQEITAIPLNYHPALVDVVTSLAYGQEEDVEQASFYLSLARGAVVARLGERTVDEEARA